MPRIYTRTGDGGETGLVDGSRASKSNPRVDLYGEVDELNSVIGMVLAAMPEGVAELQSDLAGIQADLFELGALLADPGRCEALVQDPDAPVILDGADLEPVIDRLGATLSPLRAFILPGGHAAAAALHLARTVCRRVERRTVGLRQDGLAIPEAVVVYLNRLSDLLFVAARLVNQSVGGEDVLWPGRRTADPAE